MNDFFVIIGVASKQKREYASHILKSRNLVEKDVHITDARNRSLRFQKYFSDSGDYIYCSDIPGLFNELNLDHNPEEWRLSIDSNLSSLKGLLLPNETKSTKPIIPLIYGDKERKHEDYQAIATIMQLIEYNTYKWMICSDLKVTNLCRGLKQGRPRHMCIYCLWVTTSRDFEEKWSKEWPLRSDDETIGENSVQCAAAVNQIGRFWAPPLHTKLGIVQVFIQTILKRRKNNSVSFSQLSKFLAAAMNKTANFFTTKATLTGPEIRKLVLSHREDFISLLDQDEAQAWILFEEVDKGFFGNNKIDNYHILVANMLEAFKAIGASCTYKMHLLNCHLDAFPPNCGAQGEQQGERAHQDFKRTEDRFRGPRDGHRGIAFIADHLASSHSQSDFTYSRKLTKH